MRGPHTKRKQEAKIIDRAQTARDAEYCAV